MDLLFKALFVLILSISSSAYRSNSRLKIKPRRLLDPNDESYNCTEDGKAYRRAAQTCLYKKYDTSQSETDHISKLTLKMCCYLQDAYCVDGEIIKSEREGCTLTNTTGFDTFVNETLEGWDKQCKADNIVVSEEICRPFIKPVIEVCPLTYTFDVCYEWIIPTTTQSLDDSTKPDESNIKPDGTPNGSDESTTGSDENGDKPSDTRTTTPRSGAQSLCLSVEIVIVFVATLLNF